MGKPPRQPEIALERASTRLYLRISPRFPPPPNLFPLLSNSYKYKNCSKITIKVITKEAGINAKI